MPIKVQGGKEYKLVSERLVALREKWPNATIATQAKKTPNGVIMRAVITVDDRVSCGHAYCNPGHEKALEKAETTAVGRALAFLDPDLMGSEIASADEMADFNAQETTKKLHKQFEAHMQAVLRNLDYVISIKAELAEGNLQTGLEMWRELGEDEMRLLWRAPSKGGVFSTKERALLDQASNEDHNRRMNEESEAYEGTRERPSA